jgi:hypothetical protein
MRENRNSVMTSIRAEPEAMAETLSANDMPALAEDVQPEGARRRWTWLGSLSSAPRPGWR